MARIRSTFLYGDTVYHRCSEEKSPGIVISVVDEGAHSTYWVDWGPDNGTVLHHEITLSSKFTPDFKKGDE